MNPNPVKKILNITFDGNSIDGKLAVEVFNGLGVLLCQTNLIFLDGRRVDLDVSNLHPGQYYIKIQAANGHTFTKKFQKN